MICNKLNFCSWNIHGYNSRVIGNKFNDEEFLKQFDNIDFVGVTETHIHTEVLDKMNIPGFHRLDVKNQPKNLKSNTAPKGIAVFVKENLKEFFTLVSIDNQDAIWVKMKKERSGEARDLYIGTCYFDPSNGKESDKKITKITENIISLQKRHH